MDRRDFQFLEAQLERGDFFLPEEAYDLSLYAHHLEQDMAQLETLDATEAEDWFVGEAASAITDIQHQSVLHQELVQSLTDQDNVDVESKGDIAVRADQDYSGDQAAIDDAQDRMADAARIVAFADILMNRRQHGNVAVMQALRAQVADLIDNVESGLEDSESDDSDLEDAPHPGVAEPNQQIDGPAHSEEPGVPAGITFTDDDLDDDFAGIGGVKWH